MPLSAANRDDKDELACQFAPRVRATTNARSNNLNPRRAEKEAQSRGITDTRLQVEARSLQGVIPDLIGDPIRIAANAS